MKQEKVLIVTGGAYVFAEAAHFLCSPAARAITGILLPVDAGWSSATPYRSYSGGLPWSET